MEKYSQEYVITNADMDIDYRLKPLSVIMFFEDVFARYLTTKNLAAFDLIDKDIIWIVSELNIEFVDCLPFWSEEIKVEVWISEISKLKIYVDFVIYYKDKEIAKGNSCWLILNALTKRPLSTDFISDKVDVVNQLVLGEHKKLSFLQTSEKVIDISYTTNLSDIDFNNHVNNKSYLNIASSTAFYVSEYIKNHSVKTISVKYFKEAFLGDILSCSLYKTVEENSYVHKIEKDNEPVCFISTEWEPKKGNVEIKDYKLSLR